MARQELEGVRVAILAADGFEQVEVTRPMKALADHGAAVEIVSLKSGSIRGMNLLYPGKKLDVDRTIRSVDVADYDALLLPGGFISPDALRQSEAVLDFVRAFDAAEKPIAAICHGPWVLVSAGLVRGRRLTSWPGIRDDVRNAGGLWEDKAVVVDGNWVSSRSPADLARFNQALVEHFGGMHARERSYSLPVGRLVAGGLALAAVGYGVRRFGQERDGAF